MSYRLFNYASGVTSVTLYPVRAYTEAVAQAHQLAAERAQAEHITGTEALRRYFAERLVGQVGYLAVSLALLLLTASLVHRAPDWLLCLLALAPGLLYLLALGYSCRFRPAQKAGLEPGGLEAPKDSTRQLL